MDSAAISGLAASVSALVAITALAIQDRRARALLRIELLFKFDDRFNSESFRQVRAAAASAILDDAQDWGDVEDVLDFFELMGDMARRRALDLEMVWSTFFYWINGYWCAAATLIRETRSDDATTWSELCYLRERVLRIEQRKTRAEPSDLVWSAEDTKDFLKGERTLVPSVRRSHQSSSPRPRIKPHRHEEKNGSPE